MAIRWSYSRIDRFARCRRSYQLQYLERKRGKPNDAMRFGSLLHDALERMYKEAIEDEHCGPWDRESAIAHYKDAWADCGIGSSELFAEGLDIVEQYLETHPSVDAYSVLGVETRFQIPIRGHQVIGYIDRIDRLPGDVVKIVDYKSNRMLYTDDQLKSNLQLSIYAMAARALYPWAKKVELEFDMIRHGCVQRTSRDSKQLEAAGHYVDAMVCTALEEKKFDAKLNRLCAWCDHRQNCADYQQALADGGIEGQEVGGADINELAAEREKVATIHKLTGDRQKELDAAIKTRIEMEGPIEAAGRQYEMRTRNTNVYRAQDTIDAFVEFSPLEADDVRDAITAVQSKKINALITKLKKDMPSGDHAMLRAQVGATANKRRTQFLSSSEVKADDE